MDVLTTSQRRFNMSRIRSGNTKPELALRKALFARGLRYRLHKKSLPGKPDLIFKKYRAIIMVHGCFWHGHEECVRYKPPQSEGIYWTAKIARNRQRDLDVSAELAQLGWRVMTVWECALIGRFRLPMVEVVESCEAFLRSQDSTATLRSYRQSLGGA